MYRRAVLRRPALLCALGLVVIAIWEVAVLARAKWSAATDDDWRAAAAFVDGQFAEGDLVVFAPDWVDPVGRRWLGHHLTLAAAGRIDEAAFARVWEVSIRGAHARELDGLTADVDQRFGAVRVRRAPRVAATVTWRLHDKAPISEVDFQPRQCVRLMGQRTWKGVPLGERLVVRGGLADVWARKENRAFADVVVKVDGAEIGTAQLGNDSGWALIADAQVTPGGHDVTIEVRPDATRGDPKKARLEVCLAAESRTPPPWAPEGGAR